MFSNQVYIQQAVTTKQGRIEVTVKFIGYATYVEAVGDKLSKFKVNSGYYEHNDTRVEAKGTTFKVANSLLKAKPDKWYSFFKKVSWKLFPF